MAEYIERIKALQAINEFYHDPKIDIVIRNIPKADVVEVKHGKWYLLDECANEGVYCSVCHKKVYKIDYANQKLKSKFCPNCGAKMDKGGVG